MAHANQLVPYEGNLKVSLPGNDSSVVVVFSRTVAQQLSKIIRRNS